ncbi:MAG: hypothetical protein BroJett003_06310 [Planctomycetota bacterium]|nr:MAG: hypothetical protein BroJett003_06310 [Planctomycetota bacterium]
MPKWTKAFLLIIIIGCSHSHRDIEPVNQRAPAEQTNWAARYVGDAQLAGVTVQQYPDCEGEAARYRGKHPAMALYVFKDGRVNQVGFEPDGTIKEDFWFAIEPDHWVWEQLDQTIAGKADQPPG